MWCIGAVSRLISTMANQSSRGSEELVDGKQVEAKLLPSASVSDGDGRPVEAKLLPCASVSDGEAADGKPVGAKLLSSASVGEAKMSHKLSLARFGKKGTQRKRCEQS